MPYRLLEDQSSQPPESLGQQALRTGARTLARAGETILGLPGDILQGIGNITTASNRYFNPQENIPEFKSILPTAADIRAGHKKEFGDYLEPKTTGEEFYDDLVSDFSSFALPVKGKIPFKSAITRSIAGNIGSWGAKELGYGPLGQAVAKLGFTSLAGTIGGRQALSKKMTSNYQKAEALSQGAAVDAKSLRKETDKLLSKAYAGHPTPDKKFIKEPLQSIESHLHGDKISVADAWQLKRDINTLIGDYNTPKKAIPDLIQMNRNLNGVLKEYGQTNPEFYKLFTEAEDIYRGLNAGSKLNKFLQENVSLEKALVNPLAKSLFFGGVYGLAGKGGVVATAAASLGAREGIKQLEFLYNSPTARKYYADMVKDALSGNVSAFARNANKLDKAAENYEKKNPEIGKSKYRLLD